MEILLLPWVLFTFKLLIILMTKLTEKVTELSIPDFLAVYFHSYLFE